MNGFHLDGTLGRDAEAVATQGEMGLIKFSVANGDERRKKQDGSWETVTSWFDVVFWVKDVQKYLVRLKKGATVGLAGRLKQERWEKDGQTHSKVVLVVDRWSDIHIVDRGAKKEPTDYSNVGGGSDDDIGF